MQQPPKVQFSVVFGLVGALCASLLVLLPTSAQAAQSSWQNTESITSDAFTSRDSVASSSGGTFVAWTSGTDVKLRYRAINSTFGNTITVDTGTAPTGVKLQALANNQVAVAWLDGDSSTVEVNFAKVSGTTVSDSAILDTFSGDLGSQYLNGAIDMSANATGDLALSLFVTNSSFQRRAYAATNDGSGWSALAQVSTNEIYVNNTWATMRADGSAVVVYNSLNSSTYDAELKSVIHDGSTWSAPNLFSLAGGTGNEVKPTVGSDGTIHVVWGAYTSPRKIGYATMATSASTFTSELLTTSASAQLGELAVAQDGEVSIAYVSNGNTARVITKPAGGSWGADYSAASSNTSTAAEGYSRINAEYTSTNRLIVAWTGAYDGNRDIFANVREADGTWGSAQMLTADQSQFDMNPVVVTGSNGTAMVHWQNAYGPVYFATLNNGFSTFTSQAQPGTANSSRQNEARVGVFLDADGEGTYVFEDSSSGIKYATSDTAAAPQVTQGSWKSPISALTSAPSSGSTAMDANGNIYFAWSDGGTLKYIYRASGSSFTQEASLTSSSAKGVRVTADLAGNVRFFWLDGDANGTHIYTATAANGVVSERSSLGSVTDPITAHNYPSEPITVTPGNSGRLLVTAVFNTTSYSRYAVATTFDGSQWSTLTRISGSDIYVNETKGIVRADGTYMAMYIAFNSGAGRQDAKLAVFDGTTWSAASAFNNAMHIAGTSDLLLLPTDDVVFAVTGIDSIRNTYTAEIASGSSSVAFSLVGRSDHLLAPEAALLSSGEVILAYIGRDPADQSSSTLYLNSATRSVNGTWGSAAKVAASNTITEGENYSRFALEVTSEDTAVLGWTTPWSGNGFGLKGSVKPAGAAWAAPTDFGIGNNPQVMASKDSAVATMYWLESGQTLHTATVNGGASSFTASTNHGTVTSLMGAMQQPTGDAHIFASTSGALSFLSTQTSNSVAPTMHTVTIDLTGTGEGSVSNNVNNTVCTADCSFQVQDGTALTLTATAGEVDTFAGYGNACSGLSCSVTVTNDITVGAQFNEVHQLAVNAIRPGLSGEAVEEETLTATWGSWNWTGRTSSPVYTLVWQRSADGNTWTDIAGTTDETSYTLTSSDAGKLIRVKETAVNAAGTATAVSDATEEVVGLEVDQCQSAVESPAGVMGVSINSSALYTTSRTVTISMVWDDCRSHALISNDGGFTGATRIALPTNGRATWTLPNTGSDRLPKTVYIKFESPDGSYSATVTDDIILDMTAPAVASIAKQTKVKSNYTTKIKATDTASGVYSVYFYDKNKKALKAITYRNATTIITIGTKKAVYIRLKDKAGNYTKYLAIK